MNFLVRKVIARFQLRSRPVIIDPYDKIVQRAYNKLPANMQQNIDVIKLETTCPGDKAAWVSNADLLSGNSGKERVIHLCLKKIKDNFSKTFGSNFRVNNPDQQKQMEEVITSYLRDVILPHEERHIQQELKGEGDFGHAAEPEAERAEDWSGLKNLGIQKK